MSTFLATARLKVMAAMAATVALIPLLTSLAFAATPVTPVTPIALDDGYFGWDTREIALSDAQDAIAQFPKLVAHQALILDRCGLHSINPKLAALLLDMSGTMDKAEAASQAESSARIDAFLSALPHMFYLGRQKASESRPKTHDLSQSAVPGVPETAGMSALAQTFLPGDTRAKSLASQYRERFGVRKPVRMESESESPQSKAGDITSTANPPNWMRLPWTLGQQGWSFNGAHSSSGGCTNPVCAQPRASLDFSNGWPVWGTSTTRSPVLAANDGVVTVFSTCNLRVAHPGGWATSYYHLANIRVANGSSVVAGQNLADYADTQAQALCQGGSSTGPHVHFTLSNAGVQVEVNQSDFSGWKVNATNVIRDYDSDCSRMYFTRDGNTTCAYNRGTVPAAWSTHTLAAGMASSKLCDLDIDGNNAVSITTDGVLLVRYLLGLRGTTLVTGAIAPGAIRNTFGAVESFIASKRHDFDGDNLFLPQTDGVLALRLMLGVTGTALSNGATTASSLLTTSAQINALVAGCR